MAARQAALFSFMALTFGLPLLHRHRHRHFLRFLVNEPLNLAALRGSQRISKCSKGAAKGKANSALPL
jgi:hypothetical protein